jgi:hypothetical protein
MGWDSNPRWACTHGGFQDRCLKPLGHPSFFSFCRYRVSGWDVQGMRRTRLA